MSENLVLLVEDNPKDEILALRILKKINIIDEIIVVRDGSEAIDYLYRQGNNVDLINLPKLILLDLKLPKIDGFQVLKKIREGQKTKYIPVVVFTSSTEEQDLKNSYKLGANSYIPKPIDFEQFSEVIKRLGLYWLNLNKAVGNG